MMGCVIMKERLREALEKKNMKQAELVEKTGIDKSQISSYLAGKYKPKQENLSLLAEALGVSEYWLMGMDELVEKSEETQKMERETRLQAYARSVYGGREVEKMLKLYDRLSEENRGRVLMYMERLVKVQEMEERM